jgi:hypothetical protein
MMKYLILILLITVVSCTTREIGPEKIMGWVPVYSTQSSTASPAIESVKPTVHAGKIYAYGNYLFQVEQFEGIHIIDNTVPAQAHKISFLRVPACTEIAIKSNRLYTNNLDDLVVFDISSISAPLLVSRLENAFPAFSANFPPVTQGYFECVDPSKGLVVAWEQKLIDQPKCRR